MKRRHRRRNPEPVTLLLLIGLAVAAGAGVFLISKKAKALSPANPTAKITPATTVAQAAAKATGQPIPPAVKGAPTMQDLIDSLKDPAGFAASHPGVSFDSVTDAQLNAAMDALKVQQAAEAAGQDVANGN